MTGSPRRARRGRVPRGAGANPPGGPAEDVDADPQSVARAICLRLLTAAPRTRQQLAEALAARCVPDEAADAVLDRLTAVGLVDDEAFALAWVRSRQQRRGLAPVALRAELRRRGVCEDVVERAVGEVGREEELAAARRLVGRRLATTAGLPRPARTRRLAGTLARRGYSGPLIQQVVREALDADPVLGADEALDDGEQPGREAWSSWG